MFVVLLIHAALALTVIAARSRLGRFAFAVGALGPLSLLVWLIIHGSSVVDGIAHRESIAWVPSLDLVLDLRVDAYALVFLYVIAVAGICIFLYAARYFGSGPKVGTFAGTMTLFGGAMVGLVAADHLLATFLFWELTTITSYFLIGYSDQQESARSAALHAALVTGGGGLALLAGMVMIGSEAGTFTISEILANPPSASAAMGVAWAMVLIGAVTKSAQFPFHGWLPGAMAAPTPASAYLHSATMVKAGIFLVGRLAPAALVAVEWWRPTVLAIGFATMIIGGWQALRQNDLKLLLAYGTVSQLGFLFLLVGAGDAKLLYGGLALLAAHALFKATLFMVVGTIDHEAGTRDLRRLSGLRTSLPAMFWVAVVAAASMAAFPLTFGFAAKEAAFDGLVGAGTAMIAVAAAASILTVAYTGRFLIGAFGDHHAGHEPATPVGPSPRNALVWSPVFLAAVAVVIGLAPGVVAPLFDAGVAAAREGASAGKLVVWPGFVLALGWSMFSLAIGAALVWRNDLVVWATDLVGVVAQRLPSAEGSFRRAVAGLLSFADRSSGLIQSGSLPRYIAIILLVAIALPATALFRGGVSAGSIPVGGLLEGILGLLIVAAAVTLLFTTRRFAAVLLLGGVGYGVAALFAVFGGPDLSLTQLLVETLVVALFALVLRHLPTSFTPPRFERTMRIVVAVGVAVFVFVGGLTTISARQAPPVSDRYLELSVPEAQGANVVNVILVDFRGLDTLGEITVLAIATLGVSALVVPVLRSRRESS